MRDWNDNTFDPLTTSSTYYQQRFTSPVSEHSIDYFHFRQTPKYLMFLTSEAQQPTLCSSPENNITYIPAESNSRKRRRGLPENNPQRSRAPSTCSNYAGTTPKSSSWIPSTHSDYAGLTPKSGSKTPQNQLEKQYHEGVKSELERRHLAVLEIAWWRSEESPLGEK